MRGLHGADAGSVNTRKGTASGASSFLCSGHYISRIASAAAYPHPSASRLSNRRRRIPPPSLYLYRYHAAMHRAIYTAPIIPNHLTHPIRLCAVVLHTLSYLYVPTDRQRRETHRALQGHARYTCTLTNARSSRIQLALYWVHFRANSDTSCYRASHSLTAACVYLLTTPPEQI